VDFEVELDRRIITAREVILLEQGCVIGTSRSAGENIDIYIGGVLCGSGEIVVIENNLGSASRFPRRPVGERGRHGSSATDDDGSRGTGPAWGDALVAQTARLCGHGTGSRLRSRRMESLERLPWARTIRCT